MKIEEFVEGTVCTMEPSALELLKEILIDEYLSFAILKRGRISAEVLAEKLCDYFSAVGIKTNRTFDRIIEAYMNDTDAITGHRVARTPQPKKGDEASAATPRARKYYEFALKSKGSKDLSVGALLDYARILFCLYTASMSDKDKVIENFDLSLNCIDPNTILAHMKQEEVQILFPPGKKKRFELKEKYGADACTMVMTAIILCALINERNQGVANA